MQTFDTRDDVIKTFKTHALMNGYVVIIGKYSENRHLYLHCDRNGQYRDRIKAPPGAKHRKNKHSKKWLPFADLLFYRKARS